MNKKMKKTVALNTGRTVEKLICEVCKKGKYKTLVALERHIERKHNINREAKFADEDFIHIIHYLQTYIQISKVYFTSSNEFHSPNDLIDKYMQWNGKSDITFPVKFVWMCHMMLPQEYKHYVANGSRFNLFCLSLSFYANNNNEDKCEKPLAHMIDQKSELLRMMTKQLEFIRIMPNWLEQMFYNVHSSQQVLLEFESFLQLGICANGDNYCPSKIIDVVWHACMLDHHFYTQMCNKFFRNKLLPHSLKHNENPNIQKLRYNKFKKHFAFVHGKDPLELSQIHVIDCDIEVVLTELETQMRAKIHEKTQKQQEQKKKDEQTVAAQLEQYHQQELAKALYQLQMTPARKVVGKELSRQEEIQATQRRALGCSWPNLCHCSQGCKEWSKC